MAFDLPIFLSREERRAGSDPQGLIASTSDSAHPSPQTALPQPHFLKAPVPLTPGGSPRSILERARITAGPSSGSSRVQSVIDSSVNTATRPSNLALLLGGQILFRSLS